MSHDRKTDKDKRARLNVDQNLLEQKKKFQEEMRAEELKKQKEEKLKAEKEKIEKLYGKKFHKTSDLKTSKDLVDYFSDVLQIAKKDPSELSKLNIDPARTIKELAIAIGFLYEAKELESNCAVLLKDIPFTQEDFPKIQAAFKRDELNDITRDNFATLEEFNQKIKDRAAKASIKSEAKDKLPYVDVETKAAQPTASSLEEKSPSVSNEMKLETSKVSETDKTETKVETKSQPPQSSPPTKETETKIDPRQIMQQLGKEAKQQHTLWKDKDKKDNVPPPVSEEKKTFK